MREPGEVLEVLVGNSAMKIELCCLLEFQRKSRLQVPPPHIMVTMLGDACMCNQFDCSKHCIMYRYNQHVIYVE